MTNTTWSKNMVNMIERLRAERDGVQKAIIAIGLVHAATEHPELITLMDLLSSQISAMEDAK